MTRLLHYEFKTEPMAHQLHDLEKSWNAEFHGFLWDMGSGKSKQTVDTICMLREAENLQQALIFAPKGSYFAWTMSELPKHMPERHLNSTRIHLWGGGGTVTEKRRMEDLLDTTSGLMNILVMNTEAISMAEKARTFAAQFLKAGKSLCAVDESSTIKSPDAERTKHLWKLREWTNWRRILTGTPVTRSPLDLYAQFEYLERAYFGQNSYYSFRNRYAIMQDEEITDWSKKDKLGRPGKKKIKVVVAHRNLEELSQRVARAATIIRKEDCLDLPPKTYHVRHVPLTKEQQRMYEELKRYCTTEIRDNEFVTVQHAIVLYMRFNQIVCGHVRSDSGELHNIETNKTQALEEVIGEVGGRTIVWCQYRPDVEAAAEKLRRMGRKVVEYHGGMSRDECMEAVFRFQGERTNSDGVLEKCPADLRVDDFVATISKGAYGITLTAASTEIYYSCGPDAEKRWQSEDRAHRIGQVNPVAIIDFVAPGTVEEKNAEILKRKKSLADLINDGPARLRDFFVG